MRVSAVGVAPPKTRMTAYVARSVDLPRPSRGRDLAVSMVFWTLVVAYVVAFCAMSFRRYDTFLMHSLDMGNMEQVIWNTFHGHPFHFTNMRQHIAVEAFGTNTRLSFHVEPILLPLSLLQLVAARPEALLVTQTVVLASGAWAVRRLVRRHLPGSWLAELVFPLAYLLFPALEAANLYEFHPVTLTAAFLLWAVDFGDQGRAVPFVLAGIAATFCKEEIGLVVALLALWSMRRGLTWRVAVPLAVATAAWALIAVLVIVPAAERAEHSTVATSPYLTRYLSHAMLGPGQYVHVTIGDVLRYWVSNPQQLAETIFGEAKQGYVHRLLVPVAYLAVLSPITLLVSLPSFLLIIFSIDQHMYGGLGHYTAELVGIVTAASVLGLARLAMMASQFGLRARHVVTIGCVVLLIISLANSRVNGFAPFDNSFQWPAMTPHVQLGQQMLAMIPPNAAVSAQDTLDPHLSDRAHIYLFPDYKDAQYIALDATLNPIPTNSQGLHNIVVSLLQSRRWDVLFADDGYLLLRKRATPAATAPSLPAAFYSFALATHVPTTGVSPLLVTVGDLQLLGYSISRTEVVNLRSPDVVLTMYWRTLRPITQPLVMTTYLTDVHDRPTNTFLQQPTTSWLPIPTWKPGQIMAVSSRDMGIGSTVGGTISACAAIRDPSDGSNASALDPGKLPMTIVQPDAAGTAHLVSGGQILCLGRLPVVF